MAQGMDRVTGDYNEFWAGRDYLNQLDDLTAPVLMAHAFNDWNVMPEHSYRIYEALQEKGIPTMIYYHQGGHGGQPPLDLMNKWFTRYLLGVENGIEDEPRAWITRAGDERTEPTPYPDYPHPQAENVMMYLTPGAPQQGGLTTETSGTSATETLEDNFSFSGDALAQAEWTDHRLMYLTPTLSDSVHISGVPEITVSVASSKPAANLSVWLVSLPWNSSSDAAITDNIITRGWADPQNHESISENEPLEPGEFYTFSFELQPDDQIIPAGQQIGLMIFSSDKDYTLRPDPGTELTIDLDQTSLSLPIVGGASSLSFE
jgi:X-Pro dipeptidyl-peptidase